MNPKIRFYKDEDAPEILSIVNHAILNTTAIYDYEPRSLESQIALLHEKINQGFPVFVATWNEKVVGFALYGTFRPKKAYQFTVEHSVYVAENCIGKGIGKLLMEQLIVQAKKDKIHCMVGVVDAENKESLLFHQKFGFTVSGTLKESGYKFNRWLDSVIVQLIIEN
jgi:L-amino acid N-acyltransferase